MSMEHWWDDTDRGEPNYWEKNVSVPLRPPHIPHGMSHDRTRMSAVKGRH